MITDLTPRQQAAAIIMRLTGAARDQARCITLQEITQGGVINGVQLDPVAYILAGLEMKFGQLRDEARIAAMTEFSAFSRKPNESINALLSRFEVVRNKA